MRRVIRSLFDHQDRIARSDLLALLDDDLLDRAGDGRLETDLHLHGFEQAERLAGWRLYVSNTAPERMSLAQSIDYYRDQWQPERGFHRWKRGELPALPVYLKYEARIRGLMVLLSIGLRVLTLVEFVVRRELADSQEKLPGLYEGNRKRATDRPTTERLLRAFEGIVLYCVPTGDQVSYQLTPLADLHKRILHLMSLLANLYARLVPGAEFETIS